jgi:hypothetical protein
VRRAHKQKQSKAQKAYIYIIFLCIAHTNKQSKAQKAYISSYCASRTQTSKAKHRRHINKQAQRANQQNNKQASTEGKSTKQQTSKHRGQINIGCTQTKVAYKQA